MQHTREAALAKETCAQTLMTRGQASQALGFYKVCPGGRPVGQKRRFFIILRDTGRDDIFVVACLAALLAM